METNAIDCIYCILFGKKRDLTLFDMKFAILVQNTIDDVLRECIMRLEFFKTISYLLHRRNCIVFVETTTRIASFKEDAILAGFHLCRSRSSLSLFDVPVRKENDLQRKGGWVMWGVLGTHPSSRCWTNYIMDSRKRQPPLRKTYIKTRKQAWSDKVGLSIGLQSASNRVPDSRTHINLAIASLVLHFWDI